MALRTLSLLVHADSKAGKTTLASTSPKPMLILDAEGGSKFLPLRKIEWDGNAAPPAYDGTWDAVVVIVRDFDTLVRVFQWMQFGQHDFRSLVIDSITEVQRRCKAALIGPTDAMTQQLWGQLLTRMDALIRGYRDLTLHPTKPVEVVVFIAETRQDQNGKWKPYLQGQIATALPYWMDVVGYLFVQALINSDGTPALDERGQPLKLRRLLVSPDPTYEAGERVQGRLPAVVDEPNVEVMLNMIYPEDAVLTTPTPEAITT